MQREILIIAAMLLAWPRSADAQGYDIEPQDEAIAEAIFVDAQVNVGLMDPVTGHGVRLILEQAVLAAQAEFNACPGNDELVWDQEDLQNCGEPLYVRIHSLAFVEDLLEDDPDPGAFGWAEPYMDHVTISIPNSRYWTKGCMDMQNVFHGGTQPEDNLNWWEKIGDATVRASVQVGGVLYPGTVNGHDTCAQTYSFNSPELNARKMVSYEITGGANGLSFPDCWHMNRYLEEITLKEQPEPVCSADLNYASSPADGIWGVTCGVYCGQLANGLYNDCWTGQFQIPFNSQGATDAADWCVADGLQDICGPFDPPDNYRCFMRQEIHWSRPFPYPVSTDGPITNTMGWIPPITRGVVDLAGYPGVTVARTPDVNVHRTQCEANAAIAFANPNLEFRHHTDDDNPPYFCVGVSEAIELLPATGT